MPGLNPFASNTIPYHRVSKEFTENDGECSATDTRHSTLPEEIDYLVARQTRQRSRRKHAFCYAILCLASLLTGSLLSQLFRIEIEVDGYPAPFGHSAHVLKDVVWQRNETFQAPPSAESKKAWMALMPKGKGSIRYPKDSPIEKGMTLFHGIHCLYNLHTGFHAKAYLLAKAENSIRARSFHDDPQTHSPPASPNFITRRSASPNTSPNDHPELFSSPKPFTPNPYLDAKLTDPAFLSFLDGEHLAHCFDYLRQSLMCSADSSLEDGVRNRPGDGWDGVDITGWGVKRVCRDFEAVKQWAEVWRGVESEGLN